MSSRKACATSGDHIEIVARAAIGSEPPARVKRERGLWSVRSAPLAHPAAVERDDLAARRSVGALPRRSVSALLGKLLGNPQQTLAALHLHPHVLGMNAGGDPKHREVVEKVGAFAHHGIVIA